MIELEKFLSSGGSPSDIRALLAAESSRALMKHIQVQVDVEDGVEGGEEAVKEVEVEVVPMIGRATDEEEEVAAVAVEDTDVTPDELSAVPCLQPSSFVPTDAA